MNKFTLRIDNQEMKWVINKVKYFWGDAYTTKFKIRQKLKSIFYNEGTSEYQENVGEKASLEFNERLINYREWNYFEVNPYFSIDTDLKLSTKSLSLKYLESILEDNFCIDEISTINGLLKSICFQINESIESEQNIKIEVDSDDYSTKSLLKYVSAKMSDGDFILSENDLSYNDAILIQLNMINKIADSKANIAKKNLVLLDIPLLTSVLYDWLQNSASENLKMLVFSNTSHKPDNVDDYVIVKNRFLDLSFEEELFDKIINEIDVNISVDELKEELINIISGKETVKTSKILSLI